MRCGEQMENGQNASIRSVSVVDAMRFKCALNRHGGNANDDELSRESGDRQKVDKFC